MTPYQGIGANVALKDAANLARALVAADRGERPLLDAVGDYEAEMVGYGFRAVQRSLDAMHRSITDNPLRLMTSRAVLRMVDRVAPLKRRMILAAGDD